MDATHGADASSPPVTLFLCSLVVAFVVASAIAVPGSPQRTLTGYVVGFRPGESITIGGERMDPRGPRFRLRDTTVYEDRERKPASSSVITLGAHVTVWHRNVAEGGSTADKVRLLAPATAR